MQDGATSHIAHTTELFASSCLGHPNRLTLIQLSVMGMVRRRGLANVRRFTCTAIFNGWMERNNTAHVECLGNKYATLMRSRCQTVIEANGGHSRY